MSTKELIAAFAKNMDIIIIWSIVLLFLIVNSNIFCKKGELKK